MSRVRFKKLKLFIGKFLCLFRKPGNETRIRMRQSVSKGSTTPSLEVVVCAPARGIELASQNIGFDLTIPLFRAELVEPLREDRQLILSQTRDNKFKLFNAHGSDFRVALGG